MTLARIAPAGRRVLAAVEPWYDWGRINVFRLDARTEEECTEREVRYVELQWLGLHVGVQIGRTPRKGRR